MNRRNFLTGLGALVATSFVVTSSDQGPLPEPIIDDVVSSLGPIAEDNPLAQSVHKALQDREKVEGYLAHKWGIALPKEHPYHSAAPASELCIVNDGNTYKVESSGRILEKIII